MASFLLRSINCILRDQRSFFEKFSWGSNSFFLSISDLWKKISSFSDFETKTFGKGQSFRLCSLNCIILQKKLILRKCFLRFEDLFCLFRTFCKNNSERLSKLLSMSLEDRFGKKGFFFKTCSFFHVFRTWIKHLLNFWQKSFGRVAEFPLDEPRGIIWGKQ